MSSDNPNRLRRSDRLIDAVDEWFHEHGFGWVQVDGKPARVIPWWGRLVKPLCDLRERRWQEWRRRWR